MTKATFVLEPAVYVNITCEPGDDVAMRLLRFCIDNELWPLRMGSSGPTGVEQVHYPEDADAIKAWLLENDVQNIGAE